MNFGQVRQIKGQQDDKGYDVKLAMFATFNEIGGITFTQNQKQTCKCTLVDDAAEKHTVHLYGNNLPEPQLLGTRGAFLISAFDGQGQGGPYAGYQGFWQANAQVPSQAPPPQQGYPPIQQPPQSPPASPTPPQRPQNAPQPPRPAQGARDATGVSIERQCVVKAVCGNGDLSLGDALDWCIALHYWVATGRKPDQGGQPNPNYDNNPQPIDDDIPF